MSRLRWQLRSYIVGVIVAGAGLLALATFGPHPTATEDLLVIAILLGLATVAQVWPVHLSLKVKLTVDDTPLFAAALLLGPFVSMLVAVVSALLGLHLRNARMPWYNRAFTAAVSALATGAAAVAFLALADGARPMLSQPAPILAAGAARYLTQTALVDLAVALQMKRRPFASFWTLHRRDLAQMTGLYLLGAIAAVSAAGQPLALVLFAVPMIAMLITLRDSARVREQTRAAILELAQIIDMKVRTWDEVIRVGLRGAFLCSQAAFRLMKPGGNLTGIANLDSKLTTRRIKIALELVPAADLVVLVTDPTNQPAHGIEIREAQAAAKALHLELSIVAWTGRRSAAFRSCRR